MRISLLWPRAWRLATAALPLCASLLFSTAAWSGTQAQQYQQFSTQANTMAVAAVLHFVTDPRPGGTPGRTGLENLVEAEQLTRQQAARLGLSSPALDRVLDRLETLHKLSPDATDYQPLLVELLDQHNQLSQQIAETYQQHGVTPLAELLNRQSQRVALLRLNAATRNARILGSHSLLDEQQFVQLDQEITQGFSQLESALSTAESQQLQRQQQAYRFVRATLLETGTLKNSAALELYIARMLAWLDTRAVLADAES